MTDPLAKLRAAAVAKQAAIAEWEYRVAEARLVHRESWRDIAEAAGLDRSSTQSVRTVVSRSDAVFEPLAPVSRVMDAQDDAEGQEGDSDGSVVDSVSSDVDAPEFPVEHFYSFDL